MFDRNFELKVRFETLSGLFAEPKRLAYFWLFLGEQMNPLNVGLGVVAALIYAFLGYSAQDKPFNWKKFLRTVAIGAFSALGLDLAGITFDVYTALVGPTAITVWLQKLVDTAKPS
jgi:hypothetical protein